jgi:hypothetical protein
MDNEQYLKELAQKQKLQKQTELDQARARATTELEQQKEKVMPTFEKAKQQTNVASQIGAKNLAEFWARRGQTSGGISSQAELSRQNVLGRDLGAIGQQERDTAMQFSQQATMIGQDYEDRLAQARQGIDLELSGNLYNERLRQQQVAEQRRAQAAQLAAQRRSQEATQPKSQVHKGVLIPHDYAVQNQIKGVPVSSTMMRYQVGNDFVEVPKGTNPFSGTQNKDLLDIKGKLDLSRAFGNTYQPNNVNGQPLQRTSVQANMNGQPQNVWQTSVIDKGSKLNPFDTKTTSDYYVWDGASNKYIKLNNSEKKALGLIQGSVSPSGFGGKGGGSSF